MQRLVWLLFAIIAALATGPAVAQDTPASEDIPTIPASTVPDDLQPFVGDWSLAQEDENQPTCPVTFTDQETIGGWAVNVPEPCLAPYPSVDDLFAWNIDPSDGSIILINAERHVVVRLFEDADGLYDTAADIAPRLYLLAPYDEEGAGGEADSD